MVGKRRFLSEHNFPASPDLVKLSGIRVLQALQALKFRPRCQLHRVDAWQQPTSMGPRCLECRKDQGVVLGMSCFDSVDAGDVSPTVCERGELDEILNLILGAALQYGLAVQNPDVKGVIKSRSFASQSCGLLCAAYRETCPV